MSDHLIHTDAIDWLRANQWQAQNGFYPKSHAVLCDPPYFLGSMTKRYGKEGCAPCGAGKDGSFRRLSAGFMGKQWDGFDSVWHYQDWVTEWAALLLDFVYPGAILMAFGGTRTYHRLAAGLEDAGWDVVDSMHYIYGTGFPKSHDISKAIDARVQYGGSNSRRIKQANDTRPGNSRIRTGNRNNGILGERVGPREVRDTPATAEAEAWQGYGTALKPAFEPVVIARAPRGSATYAQLAQQYGTGAFNIDGSRIETNGEVITFKHTEKTSRSAGIKGNPSAARDGQTWVNATGRWPANILLDEEAAALLDAQCGERLSGASRFFFTAKASSFEREAGLENFTPTTVNDGRQTPIDNPFQRGETLRRATHPTMKPLRLNEYLARLLLPPATVGERRLLIPFAGVASEMIGAHLAGWDVVTGLEREAEYIEQGRARLQWWTQFDSYEEAKAAHDKARKQRKQPSKDDKAQEYQQQDMFEAQQQGAD